MGPSLKGKFERRWIPGHEGEYAADTNGTIWSYKRWLIGMPLKSSLCKGRSGGGDYWQVTLWKSCVKRIGKVGYFVLLTFRGTKPKGLVLCHYDDNSQNNKLENLRWGTQSSNVIDALRNGKGSTQKLSIKDVVEIREQLSRGDLHRVIANRYGVSRQTITRVHTGYSWNHV